MITQQGSGRAAERRGSLVLGVLGTCGQSWRETCMQQGSRLSSSGKETTSGDGAKGRLTSTQRTARGKPGNLGQVQALPLVTWVTVGTFPTLFGCFSFLHHKIRVFLFGRGCQIWWILHSFGVSQMLKFCFCLFPSCMARALVS